MATRAGVAAGSLAVLLVAGGGCTSNQPAEMERPAGHPPARITLDGTVTGIALSEDSIFAVTPAGTRFPPQFHRLDRRTGREIARRTVIGQPGGMALAPDGTVWLTTTRHPDQSTGTGVQVLDAATLLPRRRLDVGPRPMSVAFAGGSAWIVSGGRLRAFEMATGEPLGAFLRTRWPAQRLLSADGDWLVVVEEGGIEVYDAAQRARIAARRIPASGSVAVARAGDVLWVAVPHDDGTAVRALALPGLAPVARGPRTGFGGTTLAASEAGVWVTDRSERRVRCLDPATGAERASVAMETLGLAAADGSQAYVGTPTGLAVLDDRCRPPGRPSGAR